MWFRAAEFPVLWNPSPTDHSSRTRFVASRLRLAYRADRLNSGVRPHDKENTVTTSKLLAPVRSRALRIGVGLVALVVGTTTFALLLFIAMHLSLPPNLFLIILSAILFAIGVFFALVAFRLLRNAPNRKGHLLPAWFYFWFGGTLTLSFFAVLWSTYKNGDFWDLVIGVISFSFIIRLCLLAHRAVTKPAPSYREV